MDCTINEIKCPKNKYDFTASDFQGLQIKDTVTKLKYFKENLVFFRIITYL